MANKRIFYAVHKVGLSRAGAKDYTSIHGLQSVGITTNFNLEQVFELGQISIYENIENIPDIEVTLEKVLDGYPLIYHLATRGSSGDTLSNRSATAVELAMSIFDDTNDSASGVPHGEVEVSGGFVSSLSYTFPVDGSFTEAVTIVANNKTWNFTVPFSFSGADMAGNSDIPLALNGASGGVNRREDLLFNYAHADGADVTNSAGIADGTASGSILPTQIPGISTSGTNDKTGDNFNCHIQNISVSTDLGREELFELGRRGPYHRFVTFPVEVTCDIEIIGITDTVAGEAGDAIDATEAGSQGNGNNLVNERIMIIAREGTKLDLSTSNKLSSVSYNGGDAGGGNVSISYSYSNFNDLAVSHPQDPG